jgi:tetratricopeptide (TPR) repeat protein
MINKVSEETNIKMRLFPVRRHLVTGSRVRTVNSGFFFEDYPMRLVTLFLPLSALLMLAGCGGRSISDYEKKQRGNALFRQAINAEESGDIDGAIRLFKQVMIDEPRAYSAHFMLATLLHDHTEDYIAAIYHYQRYIELEPDSEKRPLAEERIKIAKHLLAPQLVRSVEATSPSLQQAHLLKEAARLNGIIVRLEGEKADQTEQIERSDAVLKELAAENLRLRKIVEQMRGADAVAESAPSVRERIGEISGSGSEASAGVSRAELEALRREAAASRTDAPAASVRKPVVEVPSVKSVLDKVQHRLTGQEGADDGRKAANDRETRAVAADSDLSAFSLFKPPAKEEKDAADSAEKQIYVVQPGDTPDAHRRPFLRRQHQVEADPGCQPDANRAGRPGPSRTEYRDPLSRADSVMTKSEKRRFTKTSAANVFVGGDLSRGKVAWKLDVGRAVNLDSGEIGSGFFFRRRGRRPVVARHRLFHYISAGGIRQLKRTTIDDLVEYRRRRFMFFMFLLAIFWLVFYILPSA